jgi:predicted KAP-like P-loop ATPase
MDCLMNRPNTHPGSPFSEDRHSAPNSKESDLLGRGPFAHSIARAILGWHGRESLVLALFGGWGEGKSWVMEMVRHHLHLEGRPIPIQITFNPWEWSGQNQLAQAFFDEIGRHLQQLGVTESNSTEQEIGNDLRELGRILHNVAALGAPVSKIAGAFLPPLGAAGVVAMEFVQGFSCLLNPEPKIAKPERRTLERIKEDLITNLKQLKGVIVVFIDDIDRLDAQEIRLLFKLIKANSDFPNLVFFLAFQRDVIEKALESTIGTGSGGDFLEKIVQVPLSLPLIQPHHLRQEWIQMVDGIFERRGFGTTYEPGTAEKLWDLGIMAYIRTLRDLNRWRSSYDFHLGLFAGPNDIDARDLLVLEVFRVFEPALYSVVLRDSDPFGKDSTPGADERNIPPDEEHEENLSEFIERAQLRKGFGYHDAAFRLLKFIHPTDGNDRPWMQNPRFHQKGSRMRYFHLGLSELDFGHADKLALESSMERPNQFARLLRQFAARGLLSETFRNCEILFERNPEQGAALLFALDDSLMSSERGSSTRDLSEQQLGVLKGCLRSLRPESRWTLVHSEIRSTQNLGLAAEYIQQQVSRPGRNDPNGASDQHEIADGNVETAKTLWLARVQEVSKGSEFIKNPNLYRILICWLAWAPDKAAVREWAIRLLEKPQGDISLVRVFFGRSHPHLFIQGLETRLRQLGEITNLRELHRRLMQIQWDLTDRATKSAIENFNAVCEGYEAIFRGGSRDGPPKSSGD